MTEVGAREERERLLASLGFPEGAGAGERVSTAGPVDVVYRLPGLVDDAVVRTIWSRWRPDEPGRLDDDNFREAVKAMLSQGVAMGYGLERFRDMVRHLPELDGDWSECWLETFERAIAARGRTSVRLLLNPVDHEAFLGPSPDEKAQSWSDMLSGMADGLFYELGVVYPPLDVKPDASLPPAHFRMSFNDAELPASRGLRADQLLVNETPDRLRVLNVEAKPALNPANSNECAIVDATFKEACEATGLTTWDRRAYAVLATSAVLRAAAPGFANRSLVDYYLGTLEQVHPRLVEEVDARLRRDELAVVLRALLEEEISIRDLPSILDELVIPRSRVAADVSRYIVFAHGACAVSTHPSTPAEECIARVRSTLKRCISHKYTRGRNTLIVYLMDPKTEARLCQAPPLDDEERSRLLHAVGTEVSALPPTAQMPVILTTDAARRRLRREIRLAHPRLAVLSYQELNPDMNIQPIARIDPELGPSGQS